MGKGNQASEQAKAVCKNEYQAILFIRSTEIIVPFGFCNHFGKQ